jgi:soluble lytic murein transglycosylase-like protein
MQITSDTAQRYAGSAEANLLDPRTNVRIGARMLADLMKRFGRIDAALAAWNAGEGAVRRAGGKMPAIDETQAHVHLVLELYWALLQRSLPGQAQQMRIHSAAADLPGATQ